MAQISNPIPLTTPTRIEDTPPPKPSVGDQQVGKLTSSTGKEHSVVEIKSHSQKISTSEVESLRAAFSKRYGDVPAKQAFRLIDQRIADGKGIRGEHVLSANVAAFEMVSPGLRFANAALRANDDLNQAKTTLDQAKTELTAAQKEVKEREQDKEQYASGPLNPGLTGPLTKARERLANAEVGLKTAEKNLKTTENKLDQANEKLATFNKAIDQPLKTGEDEVRLKRDHLAARNLVVAATKDISALETELKAAKQEVEERQSDVEQYSSGTLSSLDPGLSKPLEKAKERVETAQKNLEQAKKSLAAANENLGNVEDKLQALKAGPNYRRAQKLLDNVGDDPRFMKQLDTIATGKAVGGALGTLESTLTSKKALATAVGKVPGVSVFFSFKKAITAEDQERRLGAAKGLMTDKPLAKGLAESLQHGKEMEKWKNGIAGTVGFVSTAISIPGASALGAATAPLTSALNHALQPTLGTFAGKEVAHAMMKVPMMPLTMAIKAGVEKLGSDHDNELTTAEVQSALTKLSVPDGTAMPVIPVKPFGSDHGMVRDLPLADPEVATALLAYLGPSADEGMLASSNPKTKEMEERRLTLREEMFGAGPSEDLTPGKKAGTKGLVQGLEDRSTRLAHEGVGKTPLAKLDESSVQGVSPLQLISASLGLTK